MMEKLKRLSEEEVPQLDGAPLTQFLANNREFHVTIARMTQNERVTALIGQLLDEMERFIHLGLAPRARPGETCRSHIDLFSAIQEGDGARAHQIALKEIDEARRMVIEAIMRES